MQKVQGDRALDGTRRIQNIGDFIVQSCAPSFQILLIFPKLGLFIPNKTTLAHSCECSFQKCPNSETQCLSTHTSGSTCDEAVVSSR